METYYLNDMPIEALGLTLEEGGPIMASLSLSRDNQSWPGRVGVLQGPFATVQPRVFRFVALGTKVDSLQKRTALIDGLSDLLTGIIEIRDSATPTRATRGTVRIFDTTTLAPRFVNLEPSVVVEIECPNAARWETEPESRTLLSSGTNTKTPIPCGTLPHGGRILFCGLGGAALTEQVRFVYRGITGVVLGELVIQPELAESEYGVIDLDTQQLYRVSTTVEEDPVDSWLVGGEFFMISPRDGNRAADTWPTLELNVGEALYTFRRNWLG